MEPTNTDEPPLPPVGEEPQRNKSKLIRKTSTPKIPVGFFSIIRTIQVDFQLPNLKVLSLNCVGNHTVGQIKHLVLDRMREKYPEYEKSTEGNFILTYEQEGRSYEICDLQQTFQTLQVVNAWTKDQLKGRLDVQFARVESNEERVFNLKLGTLMNVIWGKYDSRPQRLSQEEDEVYLTRRKFTNVRRRALRTRVADNYAMEPSLDRTAVPVHVARNIQVDDRISICIYGPSKSSSTVLVGIESSPIQIIQEFFDGLTPARKIAFGIEDSSQPNEFVLKVCGMAEYIWGSWEIMDFVYIRNCVARRIDPQLAVCRPPPQEGDAPLGVHDPDHLVDESTGVTEDHRQLTLEGGNKNHTEVVAFSLWDMKRKFRVKVLGIDYLTVNPDVGSPDLIYIMMSLYRGRQCLASPVTTNPVPLDQDLRWYTWHAFDIELRNIPKEASINLNVVGVFRTAPPRVRTGVTERNGESHVILRWSNMQILNHRSVLCTGKQTFKTWPMTYNDDVSFETFTGTTAPNVVGKSTTSTAELYIELDSYLHPVVFPNGGWDVEGREEEENPQHGSIAWKRLEELFQTDSLNVLCDEDKRLIRRFRSYCKGRGNSLPKVLQSVEAASLDSIVSMHALLERWPSISVEVALELLDSQYVDQKVRSLAVRTLKYLSNNKLLRYLLQLTQALQFEPYHDSALARFLLTKALQSKKIGHFFFWFLRCEIENPQVSQRYSVLLEAYLRGCGPNMLEELTRQTSAVNTLKNLSSHISLRFGKSSAKALEIVQESLRRTPLPARFQAPFDPRISVGKPLLSRVRIMDSKKRPLWLEFENADRLAVGEVDSVVRIIFKQGDDLRQDMLTIQMLGLMGKLWNDEGLDLHLLPYGCMSTGWQNGMIQIVPKANTVAKIQREFGGIIRGTFNDDVLKKWIEKRNPLKEKMEEATETFMLSCAGYCVATYVLGIGDRHNDNIMVTESGNLFHIDFGHFLGNTKSFYGIQRERVPFVLTPDFVYMMGKEDSELFQRFKDTCVHAYLVIRRHAPLFINLFHMMKSTGIPELNSVRDIRYLQNVLVLNKTEQEAGNHFLSEISGVLRKSWTVQVNWMLHRVVHSGSS